jgi:hypothetical protein
VKLELSRKQRWELAHLFLHRALELHGVDELRRFNRSRLSLGLTRIMELVTTNKGGRPRLADDNSTHVWELEEAGVEFMLEKIAKLPLNGYHAMVLGEIFDILSTYKTTRELPPTSAEPGDSKSEDWEQDWRTPEPLKSIAPNAS